MKENKLEYVDALRGIAVIGVLLVHVGFKYYSVLPEMVSNFTFAGRMGVQLFFFASAFTLFLSFSRRYEKENYPIKNFFIRRFFRIAPLYYFGIFYYLFQNGLDATKWSGGEPISFWNVINNMLFVNDFTPKYMNSVVPGGWSIGVEMTFYLIVPLLFLKVKNFNQSLILLVFSIFISGIIAYLCKGINPINNDFLWTEFIYFFFPNQLPIFALGIAYYFYNKEKGDLKISSSIYLSVLLLMLFELLLKKNLFFREHILFGFSFMLLAIILSSKNYKIIVNPIVKYIGEISFSIYIIHTAMIHFFTKYGLFNLFLTQNTILNIMIFIGVFLALLIACVVVSHFTYKYIEKPFQKIGSELILKLESKR